MTTLKTSLTLKNHTRPSNHKPEIFRDPRSIDDWSIGQPDLCFVSSTNHNAEFPKIVKNVLAMTSSAFHKLEKSARRQFRLFLD